MNMKLKMQRVSQQARTSNQQSKFQITNGMFIAMMVNLIFVKAIGVTQGVLARSIGQDMWITTMLGMFQGMVVIYITYLVLRKTPDLDFMSLAQRLLGKWFGKLIALVIFAFFMAGFGPVMLTFVYHIQDYFLPEAPLILFFVAPLLVGALGCYYGLEVMARLALVGMLFIFLLNVLIIIGSTNEFDIRNLLPVLENGFPRTFMASLNYDTDWAFATMLAAIVMPSLKNAGKIGGTTGLIGIGASGLLTMIWSILEGAVLSSEVTSQYTVSCMKLARNAHIGTFLQRYEMIMIALYSIPILFEVMFFIYATSVCATRIFGLKSNRSMIPIVSVILGTYGYWIVGDHYRAINYLEETWPRIALPIAFGLPVLLLILRLMLGKKLNKQS
ncbi:spore germination protein (amino acid permease) [Paenibacillus taihuensis]|uniref:Spore germination protein (Amino acid permease) n=1 Tax=Paenibacillus taihuensis TaxID=1156355 RepID=A0A3D9RVA2_9BACL|nr:GerAB/ArcD/ProY family transporter [Paenibacillus taihuensis]REE81026.1 spore germination protein (amino acid permease) [Paenibacillus taihuensis]